MTGLLTPWEAAALWLSLKVALTAVFAVLPLALGCAWLFARRDFPGKPLLAGLVQMPLVLPPVVFGYALLLLFGRQGPLGGLLYDLFGVTLIFNWKGAALAAAAMAFPLMVRSMQLALEAVDPDLENAARTLGATPPAAFVTVTLPLIAPGVLTALILGFARALGEFGATITFVSNIPGETQTLPLAIYSLAQTPGMEGGALRLVILSVAVALAATLLSEALARRLPVRSGADRRRALR